MTSYLLRLFRPRLAILNGISALAGYLIFPKAADPSQIISLLVGASVLAAGGSGLNQVVERQRDTLMLRTMHRPLPQGNLSPLSATAISICAVTAGSAVLAAVGGMVPVAVGGFILAWYLLVYTPLKPCTLAAVPLGAICGALPPVMGWTFAGGSPVDFQPVLLAGLLYLWQVPHFWLFYRRHESDYRRAGMGNFRCGSGRHVFPAWHLWICALCAGVALLPLVGITGRASALLCCAFLLPLALRQFFPSEKLLFRYLNLFPAVLTLSLFATGC